MSQFDLKRQNRSSILHRAVLAMAGVLFLSACSDSSVQNSARSVPVTFPNGSKIIAEAAIDNFELIRGMMYRESLAAGRGMLFYHPSEEYFEYWMYQTRIPLDIIWLDRNRRIVEISADTPPCKSEQSSECPSYGGKFKSLYVLEVGAGVAAKNGLKVGDSLQF